MIFIRDLKVTTVTKVPFSVQQMNVNQQIFRLSASTCLRWLHMHEKCGYVAVLVFECAMNSVFVNA